MRRLVVHKNWNATDVSPTPDGSYHEERDFRNNMQSVKLITDASFVVPRYNWSSGTFYDAYDDQSTGNSSAYYVVNSNQQVYMVLRKSISNTGVAVASTVEPTGNTTGTPFKTSDGYVWKMVYSISSASANKFQSANFIPVELVNKMIVRIFLLVIVLSYSTPRDRTISNSKKCSRRSNCRICN